MAAEAPTLRSALKEKGKIYVPLNYASSFPKIPNIFLLIISLARTMSLGHFKEVWTFEQGNEGKRALETDDG